MCPLESFLRFTLLLLLSLAVVQFFTQREAFHPWNKYGSSVIKKIASNPTNTTRIEYEYVSSNFPYKNAIQNKPSPIPPITYKQISERT
tara:strand:- start:6007 stop:6273 length:267 start_codon:yes stop_codon:yes gene_type:complete